MFESNPSKYDTAEDHEKYVADSLLDFRFMYKDPDAMVSFVYHVML